MPFAVEQGTAAGSSTVENSAKVGTAGFVRVSVRVARGSVSCTVNVEMENRTQVIATRTADMEEAVAAFKEKREAEFQYR